MVDLDLFYGKVKFGNLGFSIGKSENCWFFQNYCSLWLLTDWDNEDMWVLKVKVISWPRPKVIYIQNLKLAFLRNHWANQSQILCGASLGRGNKSLYINDPGHMTKMAAMLRNAQNLKKSSSPEPLGQLPWNLACSIRVCSTTKFI